MPTPSTVTSSMTTGGGTGLTGIRRGSTTATPFVVANQSRPSRVRNPAGCPLAHWLEGSPSEVPKRAQTRSEAPSRMAASSADRATRKTPRFVPSQRSPNPSSRIVATPIPASSPTVSSRMKRPSRRRQRPCCVPIQSVPSGSAKKDRTEPSGNPSMNRSILPSWKRLRPFASDPIQTAPAGSTANAVIRLLSRPSCFE